MSLAKKTGIYISAINVPIVEKVKADFGYTKDSNAINFIISDWQRLKNEETKPDKKPVEVVDEVKKPSLDGWFVSEDKNA